MMKNLIMATALGLALPCIFFSSPGQAGEALDAVNAQVETTATSIDDKYGVLLSAFERNNLKIALVARRVLADVKDLSAQALAEKAQAAFAVYEISDPTDQRQLLIELEAQAQKSTGNSGTEPPQ